MRKYVPLQFGDDKSWYLYDQKEGLDLRSLVFKVVPDILSTKGKTP